MPELPEVECVRRSLEPLLIGRRVDAVRVARRDVLVAPGDPAGGFSRQRDAGTPATFADDLLLVGRRIARLRRHGKQLAIESDAATAVIVQLGMTGRLEHAPGRVPPEPHTHVLWELEGGSLLRFIDARRFGLVRIAPGGPGPVWEPLGPDALTIRADRLARRLSVASRPIKAALLDQGVLAGVGNIYADEALHRAGLNPMRVARTLTAEETGRLARSIRQTLRRAIERGGSSIRDYRDGLGRAGAYQSRHLVYGRGGEACRRCGGRLEQALVAQRTTVWCPACQPA